MFKDYVVVDSFFDNAHNILGKFHSVEYYTKETNIIPEVKIKTIDENLPPGNWEGFRSDLISNIDPILFSEISTNIKNKVFSVNNFYWEAQAYFHLSPNNIDNRDQLTWWHTDPYAFAGVIYMNPNPENNTGTVLKIDNKEVVIENKFNRLAFYKGSIEHKPDSLSGSNIDDVRKTITIFVGKVGISY